MSLEIVLLPVNDPTPDVTHIEHGKTQNTSTTAYTYFDGTTHGGVSGAFTGDGKTGRWYTHHVNDNYSSITHDVTKIKLIGGISLRVAIGDEILFWLNPSNYVWEEKNRRLY